MRYIYLFLLTFIFTTKIVFAYEMSLESKPCGMIAKACLKAGYVHSETDKKFWMDCMKPVILGKTVKGVTVDEDTVKSCRMNKINMLQQDLKDFEDVK